MSATRAFYRSLAESVRYTLPTMTPKQTEGATAIVRALACDLKRDNPRFRFDLFYEACGLDDYGEAPKKRKERS